MQRASDWTLQRMDLLSKLIDVLSRTMDEWNTFISLNRDIGYFSDLNKFLSSANSHEIRDLVILARPCETSNNHLKS
jgi:hypothetical protein